MSIKNLMLVLLEREYKLKAETCHSAKARASIFSKKAQTKQSVLGYMHNSVLLR